MTDVINPLLFALWHDLNDVRVLWQAGAIGACLLFALWLSFVVRRKLRRGDSKRHEIGLGGVGRFVFSLSALVLVLTGRWVSHICITASACSTSPFRCSPRWR